MNGLNYSTNPYHNHSKTWLKPGSCRVNLPHGMIVLAKSALLGAGSGFQNIFLLQACRHHSWGFLFRDFPRMETISSHWLLPQLWINWSLLGREVRRSWCTAEQSSMQSYEVRGKIERNIGDLHKYSVLVSLATSFHRQGRKMGKKGDWTGFPQEGHSFSISSGQWIRPRHLLPLRVQGQELTETWHGIA